MGQAGRERESRIVTVRQRGNQGVETAVDSRILPCHSYPHSNTRSLIGTLIGTCGSRDSPTYS